MPIRWEHFESYDDLSARAAALLLETIRASPHAVLGLPTGRTPVGMYQRLVRDCARSYHCFRDVVTFNLDEYAGIDASHPGSYHHFMQEQLFDHVDIDPRNVHIPDGAAADPDAECRRYEALIRDCGGLDLTFLGLGTNGHIGFNEPSTPFDSRTRLVALSLSTRVANAPLFPDGHVPTHALTMGIGTILESKRIVLLAAGEKKREAIARLQSGKIDELFPASALWLHGDVTVLVSER